MKKYKVRSFQILDLEAIRKLEKKYQSTYPDANYSWTSAYLFNPSLSLNDVIFCLVDENDKLAGHGHIYPVLTNKLTEDHKLFIHIKTDPNLPNQDHLRNLLYTSILNKAHVIAADILPNNCKLFIQYFASENDILNYFSKKGFTFFRKHEFKSRLLDSDLPPVPQGFTIKAWIPKNKEEKLIYINAKQRAFPDVTLTINDLDFQMQAPFWLLISAFSEENELTGSIMLLQPPWEEDKVFTEDIFVLPSAKHKGIARAMNIYAFHELKLRGKTHAMLTVDSGNIAAKTLSESLGYRTVKEELFLSRSLSE